MIDPILYSLDVAPAAWILLGAAALCMLLTALIWWPRLTRVTRRAHADSASMADEAPTAFPPVSVIVYSQADGHNLRTLLPQILGQDYPSPFEVIVVNDESSDNTETIVNELELKHPNLYMTFAPERARNLSRRKLSITLGIKAARYDALLHTCGNSRVESPLWMRAMMRHFAAGKEVVIGYAEPTGEDLADTDRRPRRRAFDFMWQAVRGLSSAIAGLPFMGTGYNLAYSRRLFFSHKGFSRTLNLNYGDDDIFIREIATRANTAVELSAEARVRAVEYSPAELHDIYRMRRDFTARYLPRRSYRALGISSLLWWLWPPVAVAAGLLGWPSLVPAAAALLLALTFCIIHMVLWRRCSVALGLRPLRLTVPWLALTRPFRTLRHRLRGRRHRTANFTHLV